MHIDFLLTCLSVFISHPPTHLNRLELGIVYVSLLYPQSFRECYLLFSQDCCALVKKGLKTRFHIKYR